MLSVSATKSICTPCGLPKVKFGQKSHRKGVSTCAVASQGSEQATATDSTHVRVQMKSGRVLRHRDQVCADMLREKTRHYKENDLELDFFLVCEPAWLEQQHPAEAKKVGKPCVALVGKEENWVRYMKLRLDRVLFLKIEGTKEEVTKCGAAVPQFERLDAKDNWIAPYSPYKPGWWEVFMPGAIEA